jgi:hypothetical protein
MNFVNSVNNDDALLLPTMKVSALGENILKLGRYRLNDLLG